MVNKKYKLIIFDLDGTLSDTSEGINKCYKHALVYMGRPEPADSELKNVIGGSLLKTFQDKFGFSEEDALKATTEYRNRYKQKGVYECKLYNGMKDTLQELKARGYMLAVATLKAENLAKIVLSNLGVADLFNLIHGVDSKDTLTKSDLINMCVSELGCEDFESVLVGDSIHDANGAKKSNVDFIAALYGFGFKTTDDLNQVPHVNQINSTLDLLKIL